MALEGNPVQWFREDIRFVRFSRDKRDSHQPSTAKLAHLEVLALDMSGVGSGVFLDSGERTDQTGSCGAFDCPPRPR